MLRHSLSPNLQIQIHEMDEEGAFLGLTPIWKITHWAFICFVRMVDCLDPNV